MGDSQVLPNSCSAKKQDGFSKNVEPFLNHLGKSLVLPETSAKENFLVNLVCGALKLETARPGHVSFSLTVFPQLSNFYNTLHGGAVGVIAVVVAQACVMTVAGEKEFFLGESSISYLSSSRIDEQLDVEGHMLRQGRSVIVVSLEFKAKKIGKLTYAGHFTFYSKAPPKL